jgi:GGDEF domain-containing protein
VLANTFYMPAVALVAFAAWQRPRAFTAPRLEGLSVLFAPALFSLGALGLLVYDHFQRLEALALLLSVLTLLAALGRAALTFRDVRDIAETKRQALTDDLTSLPNRRLFLTRLAEAAVAARGAGRSLGLLIVGLDHFKQLNDTLGRNAGDALLRELGPRMNGVVRPTDTVARLGGDEFGIVLAPPSDEASALRIGCAAH